MLSEEYSCSDYPCLHVVVDYKRKVYAVFMETSDGDIIYVPVVKIKDAYEKIKELEKKHFREAKDNEVDELAAEKLGALAIEEEE
ncbi:hypothetical protein J4526_01185 [Desulfurococcaceae archaeon MEX13E-LK6-19]|nr:hypothetical protein J4526_01185 [Desulfurococcaceae archaeon MEX13E-LK6-19]